MYFTINGNYEAYLYVVLLQLSILYLQRLDLNQRMSADDAKTLSPTINDYLLTTRFVAAGFNWASWLFSVYVGQEFGLASAALFLILGLCTSVLATIYIPPMPRVDVIAHVVSWPVTIYLFRATLAALGVQTPI